MAVFVLMIDTWRTAVDGGPLLDVLGRILRVSQAGVFTIATLGRLTFSFYLVLLDYPFRSSRWGVCKSQHYRRSVSCVLRVLLTFLLDASFTLSSCSDMGPRAKARTWVLEHKAVSSRCVLLAS